MKKKLNDEDIQRLLSEGDNLDALEKATNPQDVAAYQALFEVLAEGTSFENSEALEEKIIASIAAKPKARWWAFENMIWVLVIGTFILATSFLLSVLPEKLINSLISGPFLPLVAFTGSTILFFQWWSKKWMKKIKKPSSE
ncbi:hypothetical protein BKI52_20815 [marine bacterium AO1-C]|nr:hypothetical protein BKI52_20815 [marine bacterium AO1-C]